VEDKMCRTKERNTDGKKRKGRKEDVKDLTRISALLAPLTFSKCET
jgi:hypothetical protein